jgi:hypothetical protein
MAAYEKFECSLPTLYRSFRSEEPNGWCSAIPNGCGSLAKVDRHRDVEVRFLKRGGITPAIGRTLAARFLNDCRT